MRASRLIKTSLYIEMLVVAVLVCFFVALQINKSVKRYQENEVSQKLDLISHQLNQFMDTHFIVLQEIASKPLLVQSIMQPEENMGTLTDYFQDMQVLGRRYDTVLVDFSGALIYTNEETKQKDSSLEQWFSSLASKHQDLFLGTLLSTTGTKWLMSVPIRYNGEFEGAILIKVPVYEYLSLSGIDITQSHCKISFLTDDGNQAVFGRGEYESAISKQLALSPFGLKINFTHNLDSFNRDRLTIIVHIGLIIIFILIIATTASHLFTKRLFIKPLLEIGESALAFGKTGEKIEINQQYIIDEFAKLAVTFNGMLNDVFDREASLDEVNRQINTIMDTAADSIITLSSEGIIRSVNLSGTKLLGVSVDKLIGQNINMYASSLRSLREMFNGRDFVTCEQKIINNNNVELIVEISMSQLMIDSNVQYTLILRDVTRRKLVEERLRTSHRMASLGRMSAGIFHEILNPVNIISCGVQSLLIDEKIDAHIKEDLRVFQGEIERVTKITRGILAFSRSHVDTHENVLVHDIIEDVLGIIGSELILCNIEVLKIFSDKIPSCKIDKYSMRQVFLNIVNNAKDAMAGGGTLEVRTELVNLPSDSALIRIKIKDTGCGISDENIGKVFEPFFTTKEEGKGTGLGLSESYRIVEAHEGTMHVESKPGEGTVFIIDLPLDRLDKI